MAQQPTIEEHTANNLDSVAKALAGATVAITALLSALGISTDAVSVAFNNRPDLIGFALAGAVLAVTLSLIALLVPPISRTLLVVEAALLLLGVVAYAGGLVAVVFSVSDAANSEGRPTFTNVNLERPGKQARLSFKLKADGVKRDGLILVLVQSTKLVEEHQGQAVTYQKAGPDRPIFGAYLRPDAAGAVEHEIVVPFDPAGTTDLTIQAWSSKDGEPDCEARRNIGSGCATVRIPAAPAPAK